MSVSHPGVPLRLAPSNEIAELCARGAGAVVDQAGDLEIAAAVREGSVGFRLSVHHRLSGSLRALTLFRPELVAGPESQRLLCEHLERAVATRTEHCAQVLEHGSLSLALPGRPSAYYELSEWVEGPSLATLLDADEGQPMPPDRAFHLALQAARCLAELHGQGLLHGDVRAESFIVAPGGRLRLVDLGIPPAVRARAGGGWRTSAVAPPELVERGVEGLEPSGDVYQLALLVYRLFAGIACSPWTGYEELCEIADFLPVELDELVQASLGPADERPNGGGDFFTRLREAEFAFGENQRGHRPRVQRRARDLIAQASELARRTSPPWGWIGALCERSLEEKPGILAFSRRYRRPAEDLLAHAREELMGARRRHLEFLLSRSDAAAAEAFLDVIAARVAATEIAELRTVLEAAGAGSAPVMSELLREPSGEWERQAPPLARERTQELAVSASAELSFTAPPERAASRASEVEPADVPATQRWRLLLGGESAVLRVVVGPTLRLGRGSFEEFGNHVDLRPTQREASESSTALALAQTVSRAGHLELRVTEAGVEAVCLGLHGALIDGRPLSRGERTLLARAGACSLARGASSFTYALLPEGAAVEMVELRFIGGVGEGRRAFWVLTRLDGSRLAPELAGRAAFLLRPDGWWVEALAAGVQVDGRRVAPGERDRWPDGATLGVGELCLLQRG